MGENTETNEINLEIVDATNNSSNSAVGAITPASPINKRQSSPLPTVLMIIGGVLVAGFGSPLLIGELRQRHKI